VPKLLHSVPSQRIVNVNRELYPPATIIFNAIAKGLNNGWNSG
jgi:hypothetical protein